MNKIRSRLAVAGLALAALGVSGCQPVNDAIETIPFHYIDYALGWVPWFADLREDVSYDPYELPRLPAEHSIPVAGPNQQFPPVLTLDFSQGDLDSIAAVISNPLQPTPEVLALGRDIYLSQCATCHGPQGEGNGPVVGPGKFPFAPSVNGVGGPARSASYVWAITAVGRGLMPPYGYKLDDAEQWAVSTYVQYLQQQAGVAAPAPVAPAAVTAPAQSAAAAPAVAPAEADQPR